MKRILSLLIACILLLSFAACTSTDKKKEGEIKVTKPSYEIAEKRADSGYVFYADDKLIGLEIQAVGIFLYDIKEKKLIEEFKPVLKDGQDKFSAYMSKDLKSLVISIVDAKSDGRIFNYYQYDLTSKDKKLIPIEKDSVELADFKGEIVNLENDSWKLEDLYYQKDANSDKIYIFRK